MEQKKRFCDFGEEDVITESNYQDALQPQNDEFNMDEDDLDAWFGEDGIDHSRDFDETIEYTGSVDGTAFMQSDLEVIEEAQTVESPEKSENIIDTENISVGREATKEETEKAEKSHTMVIEAVEIISEAIEDGVRTELNTSMQAKKVREYKNKAVYFKGKFAKAKTEDNPLKKLIFMAIAAAAAGVFGGVYANSYFIAKHGQVESMMSCAFSWIMEFDTLTVSIDPFNSGAFFAGFALWGGILAVIFLLSSLNSSNMKNSRVGHEHGNAKLMDNSSFKKYKNRFMER